LKADAPQDPRALIVVGKSSSHCSACGNETLAIRFHSHIGSSTEEGCGIEFLGVTSLYAGRLFREGAEMVGKRAGLPYVYSVPEGGGTVVIVSNYDAAIQFYTGVLGLSVEEDMTIEPGGKRWVLLDSHERYLSVLLLEPRLTPSSFLKLDVTYYTDDVWRTVAEWKEKGIVLVSEPEATDWGMKAEFEDPDGNRIAVVHSRRTLG
jgi:predicted enzyme related to lactoylglutathione lyase